MRQVALFTTVGFWPDRIGIQRTKELAFTGRLVEGPEAVELGLFTGRLVEGPEAVELGLAVECVPDEQLEERVDTLAAQIAGVDVDRLMVVKAAINGWAEARGVRGAAFRGGEYHAIFHQCSVPVGSGD
jgi:enoyl-CoA hydratase/carnithine racemase